MKNKIYNFFLKRWPWAVFFIFTLMSLFFLIRQPGIWAFADSGFYYNSLSQALAIAVSKLSYFSQTDGFYFGYDNSALGFSHLLISFYQVALTFIFGPTLGQVLYYFIYYLLIFYFGAKLLKLLFPVYGRLEISLGALFLAFNPFSLLIITLFTIGYVYAANIIFLYGFLSYLKNGKMSFLVLAVIAAPQLVSYLRLIPIVILTCLLVLMLFRRNLTINYPRLFGALVILLLVTAPFWTGNILAASSPDNIVSNYQDFFLKFEIANYNFKSSFINSFSYSGGFTPSSLSYFYNNRGIPGFADNYAVTGTFEFFKTMQIIFNAGILVAALYFFRGRQNIKIVSLILLVTGINTLGYFLPRSFFSFINQNILVFLYNDYGFLQFIQVFLYSFLIVSVASGLKNISIKRYHKDLFLGLILIYMAINTLPLLTSHYGLKKINRQNIPNEYQQTFFKTSESYFKEAAIFAPYHWLKFDWAPYFIDLNLAPQSKYQSLIVPNLRLVGDEFVDFYNKIYTNFSQPNFGNLSIFNIKNIFLFTDITDANSNIDTYGVLNQRNSSQKILNELLARSDFLLKSANTRYYHFRLLGAEDYDFFVYSPKTVYDIDLDNFYQRQFDLAGKPVLVDRTDINEFSLTNDINFKLNSSYVYIKASLLNPNKYLLKLRVDKNSPFLLQLNQAYSKSWQVYFVDEKTYQRHQCQKTSYFALTENERCLASYPAMDLTDISLVFNPRLPASNHFVGNVIGNTFLISPENIPENYRAGEELYLVIYFQKQIYYILSLLASLITLFIVIIMALAELAMRKPKYENGK